jgi:DNA-binding NtrC family response regulator
LALPEMAMMAASAARPAPSVGIDLSVPIKLACDRLLEEFDLTYIRAMLAATGGNVSRAAQRAGVNRKFVQRAMKRYGLNARGELEPGDAD